MNGAKLIKQCIVEVLEDQGYGNPGLESNIQKTRSEIVGIVDKLQYRDLVKVLEWVRYVAHIDETISESENSIEITPTGTEDDWNRPIYKGKDGKIYVDVNLGNGTPSIHSVTDEGEPDFPVKNFTISGTTSKEDRFKNALCPRCKNSKPELMRRTPDGKMSCTSCHWEDNPGEPYNPPNELRKMVKECIKEVLKKKLLNEGFDPTSMGPNIEATEGQSITNPYEKWNANMRKMETVDPSIPEKKSYGYRPADDQTTHTNLPPSGEEKYNKQEPGGSMGTSNTSTLAIESLSSNPHGRYAQEAGADGFDPRRFAVNGDEQLEHFEPCNATSNYWHSPTGKLYRMTKDASKTRKGREHSMKKSRSSIQKLGLNVKEDVRTQNPNVIKTQSEIYTELKRNGFTQGNGMTYEVHDKTKGFDLGVWCYVDQSRNSVRVSMYQGTEDGDGYESDDLKTYDFQIPNLYDEYDTGFSNKIVELCLILKQSVQKQIS